MSVIEIQYVIGSHCKEGMKTFDAWKLYFLFLIAMFLKLLVLSFNNMEVAGLHHYRRLFPFAIPLLRKTLIFIVIIIYSPGHIKRMHDVTLCMMSTFGNRPRRPPTPCERIHAHRIRMVHLHAEPRATCRPCMSSSELSSWLDCTTAATDGLSRRGCTIASIALPSRRHVRHVADVEIRAHHVVFRRLVQLLQCAHLCTSTKHVS